MSKFFISKEQILNDTVIINNEDAFHIHSVLRLKIGEKIQVCSCDGFDYECEITEIKKDMVLAKILDCFFNASEPKTKITLYQGLPKSEKMELVIQKSVELGVDTIVPINTQRTIVKLNGKEDKKILRWNKIANSSAKQSRRGKVPKVENIMSFSDAILASKQKDLAIIPYEKETENTIKNLNLKLGSQIAIFVGPEGGFTEQEIDFAIKNNVIPITLGKRILRTETAGMFVTGILLHELQD